MNVKESIDKVESLPSWNSSPAVLQQNPHQKRVKKLDPPGFVKTMGLPREQVKETISIHADGSTVLSSDIDQELEGQDFPITIIELLKDDHSEENLSVKGSNDNNFPLTLYATTDDSETRQNNSASYDGDIDLGDSCTDTTGHNVLYFNTLPENTALTVGGGAESIFRGFTDHLISAWYPKGTDNTSMEPPHNSLTQDKGDDDNEDEDDIDDGSLTITLPRDKATMSTLTWCGFMMFSPNNSMLADDSSTGSDDDDSLQLKPAKDKKKEMRKNLKDFLSDKDCVYLSEKGIISVNESLTMSRRERTVGTSPPCATKCARLDELAPRTVRFQDATIQSPFVPIGSIASTVSEDNTKSQRRYFPYHAHQPGATTTNKDTQFFTSCFPSDFCIGPNDFKSFDEVKGYKPETDEESGDGDALTSKGKAAQDGLEARLSKPQVKGPIKPVLKVSTPDAVGATLMPDEDVVPTPQQTSASPSTPLLLHPKPDASPTHEKMTQLQLRCIANTPGDNSGDYRSSGGSPPRLGSAQGAFEPHFSFLQKSPLSIFHNYKNDDDDGTDDEDATNASTVGERRSRTIDAVANQEDMPEDTDTQDDLSEASEVLSMDEYDTKLSKDESKSDLENEEPVNVKRSNVLKGKQDDTKSLAKHLAMLQPDDAETEYQQFHHLLRVKLMADSNAPIIVNSCGVIIQEKPRRNNSSRDDVISPPCLHTHTSSENEDAYPTITYLRYLADNYDSEPEPFISRDNSSDNESLIDYELLERHVDDFLRSDTMQVKN